MKARDYINYLIVGATSLVMVCLLPMFGSEIGLGWETPTTAAGWLLFGVTKGSAAVCNMTIFHCFVRQGVYNVRDNARYKEACAILDKLTRETKPRSPAKYYARTYGFKGTGIFVFSAASVIGLTNALLTYDLIAAVAYIVTVVFGVVFGILQMRNTEDYFTNEFWRYAKEMESEYVREGRKNMAEPAGAGALSDEAA